MEKANIIKAMECCFSSAFSNKCSECPFNGEENCHEKLLMDAVNALSTKASEAPKAKYTFAIIYTKRTNLSAYFMDKVSYERVASREQYESLRNYYARERDVQLVASFRWDNRKLMCRIKCPINPIPVKGEFEVPSYGVFANFLKANGWEYKQKLSASMFM